MLRKLISCVLFSILLTSLIALKTNPVKSQNTITVPDDFPTIQEAINNANEGDTIFAKSGTYYEHIMVDKDWVSLIGESPETTIIDGNGTGVDVITVISNNVSITGFTIRGSGLYSSAISLGVVYYCNIFGNNIIDNYFGFYFENTGANPVAWTYNNIFRNNITNNSIGIELGIACDLNTISGNRIVTNNIGIAIESSNNTISGNYIVENTEGIHFYHGEMNGAWDNRIMENDIVSNQYGLYVVGGMLFNAGSPEANFLVSEELSYSEEIYHNNFVLNTCHVYLRSGDLYVWDSGYPSGGNYWNDLNPLDIYSGPYQNETGSDRIGDTPYIIDAKNVDKYPLVYPFGYVPSPDLNNDGKIDIIDLVKIALAYGSVPGFPIWNPYVDLNQDGIIDIFDLVAIAVNFGKEWSSP